MTVLFLALDFPEIGRGSNLYTDLMEEFRDQGHVVYVIASSVETGETGLFNEAGIHVMRARGTEHQNVGLIRKGLANLMLPFNYMSVIKRHLNKDINLDLVILPTPPITLTIVAKKLKKRWGSKVYLILRDIFPQNAVDLEFMGKGGLVYRFFRSLEQKLYKVADYIGCMSQANIDYVQQHNDVQKDKLHLLQNWQREYHYGEVDAATIISKYGLEGKYLIFFGGNISKPQAVANIADFMEVCKTNPKISFFIVGKGTEKSRLERLIDEKNLDNVIVKDFVPREEYLQLLQVANAGLISLDERFTIPNCPSKSLSYFNAEIPVLALLDEATDFGHWITDEVKAGYWSLAKEPEALKAKVDYLIENPEMAKQFGENGYKYFIEHLNTGVAYNTIIKKAIDNV